ncbi:MAG: hypothetical protein ACYDHY_04300 [Acidiferrobacterales bacterium]
MTLGHPPPCGRTGNRIVSGSLARPACLLLAVLLAGCVTTPVTAPGIALDSSRLERSKYLEFVYAGKELPTIEYRQRLVHMNTSVPPLQCPLSSPVTGTRPVVAAWVWRSEALLHDRNAARAFLQRAAAHGISALYLQIHPDLNSFAGFLELARSHNIRVFALGGSPGDVDDYGPDLRTVDRVLAYNRSHTAGFSGIQFDIEPYLLRRYRSNRQAVLRRYAGLLRALHARSAGRIPFEVVIPFWFDQEAVGGRNLEGIVFRNADSVAIMSYRTRIGQLRAISNKGLCYGRMYGKPVMLGIELGHIPTETHYFLAVSQLAPYIRMSDGHPYLAKDPRDFTHYARQYRVPGSEISFYPHVRAAFRYTRSPIPYRSFSGWIMDGLDRVWIR